MITIKYGAISYTYSKFTKTVSLIFIFLRIKDKLQKNILDHKHVFHGHRKMQNSLSHIQQIHKNSVAMKSKESYLGSKQSTFILYYFSMSRQAKKNVNFSIEQVGRVR